MQDFTQFHEECERGARLNELADFFSSTAAGRAGVPIRRPSLDYRLLERNPETERFAALHAVRQGPFDQHYLSSIPYRYEEEIRLGTAILRYSSAGQPPLTLYSLGTAEGTMARTISELADGRVLSLSCSPTIENKESFYAWGVQSMPNSSSAPLITCHRNRSAKHLDFRTLRQVLILSSKIQHFKCTRRTASSRSLLSDVI